MALVAVDGAKITCTGVIGPVMSTVEGTCDVQVTGCDDSILTKSDKEVDTNIKKFTGKCKFMYEKVGPIVINKQCDPVITADWRKTVPSFGDTNEPVLIKNSCINCSRGGLIEIVDANQTHINVWELGKLFVNGYTVEDIDSMLANGWTLEYLDAAIEVYGFSIDYRKVNVNSHANSAKLNAHFNENGSRPFVGGNSILSDGSLSVAVFIHELMHSYQFQHGGIRGLYGNRIVNGDYYYVRSNIIDGSGESIFDYGVEQQGEIMKDYYIMTNYKGKFPYTIEEEDSEGNTVITTFKDEKELNDAINNYKPLIEEVQNSGIGNNGIPDVVSDVVVGGIEAGSDGANSLIEDGNEIIEETERGLLEWFYSPPWGGF